MGIIGSGVCLISCEGDGVFQRVTGKTQLVVCEEGRCVYVEKRQVVVSSQNKFFLKKPYLFY